MSQVSDNFSPLHFSNLPSFCLVGTHARTHALVRGNQVHISVVDTPGRITIDSSSQHPHSVEEIQRLEDYSRYTRMESEEETRAHPPVFTKQLTNLGQLVEGSYAHFEAQIQPVSDPYMRVEWFHNGRSLTASKSALHAWRYAYAYAYCISIQSQSLFWNTS